MARLAVFRIPSDLKGICHPSLFSLDFARLRMCAQASWHRRCYRTAQLETTSVPVARKPAGERMAMRFERYEVGEFFDETSSRFDSSRPAMCTIGAIQKVPRVPRSAGFQPAVSQASSLPGLRKLPLLWLCRRPADWKSAIQQIGNLRYSFVQRCLHATRLQTH